MARFGIKEVADVTFYNIATGKPELFFDTLKLSNLENNAETVYAEGGRGAGRILGWDFNRTANFNMQDALLSMQSLAALAGNAVQNGVQNIRNREVLVVTGGKVTIAETPIANSIMAYRTTDGKILGAELVVGTITGMEVALSGGAPAIADGDMVVVFYKYSSDVSTEMITFAADKYPAYYNVVADGLVRNESTGLDEPVQLEIPKARLTPGFTLTMDASNVSVFDFNMEVFKTTTKEMVRVIKY